MTTAFQSPILIFGCRRSGTTLLRSLLESHPHLHVHPQEPQFILNLALRFKDINREKKTIISTLLAHPYLPENINKQQLKVALSDPTIQTWPDFFQTYLEVWVGKLDANEKIVLKDPAFTFHIDTLDHIFPNAHYIHVVRHPYGNVSSQRARWQNATIWECANWWRDAVTIGHRMAMAEPERCLEVDYQSLVLQPEPNLKQICHFLNIPFMSQMLEFKLDTISFSPDAPPKPTQFTTLEPQRLERWRNYLSPMDIKVIEQCCKREMSWWQYETVNPSVSNTKLRWRIAKEKIIYAALRNGRKLKYQTLTLKNRMAS